MVKTAWTKGGKVVVDSQGRIPLCDHCPCDDNHIIWDGGCGCPPGTLMPKHLHLWYGRHGGRYGEFADLAPVSYRQLLTYDPAQSPNLSGTRLLTYRLYISDSALGPVSFEFVLTNLCEVVLSASPVESMLLDFGHTPCDEGLFFSCFPAIMPCSLFDQSLYYGITDGLTGLFEFPCLNYDYDWLYVTTSPLGLTPRSYNGCPPGFGV